MQFLFLIQISPIVSQMCFYDSCIQSSLQSRSTNCVWLFHFFVLFESCRTPPHLLPLKKSHKNLYVPFKSINVEYFSTIYIESGKREREKWSPDHYQETCFPVPYDCIVTKSQTRRKDFHSPFLEIFKSKTGTDPSGMILVPARSQWATARPSIPAALSSKHPKVPQNQKQNPCRKPQAHRQH